MFDFKTGCILNCNVLFIIEGTGEMETMRENEYDIFEGIPGTQGRIKGLFISPIVVWDSFSFISSIFYRWKNFGMTPFNC